MLASCKGGTERNFAEDAWNDPGRFLPPVPDNLSCGQRKGNATVLDPRTLPISISIFVVAADGRILADCDACAAQGVAVEQANRAIRKLGLNAERLRIQRVAILEALARYPSTPAVWDALARRNLLPDTSGRLRPWFTTTRTFLRGVAEIVLAQPPQDWIAP